MQINPALTGGCFSLGISTILTVVLSLIFPQHYDWVGTRTLSVFNDTSKDVSHAAWWQSEADMLCHIASYVQGLLHPCLLPQPSHACLGAQRRSAGQTQDVTASEYLQQPTRIAWPESTA